MLLNSLGDAFEAAGTVYMSDDDPELVKAAFPFNLKTIEILLAQDPDNPTLLLAAASGFTMYAYAFVKEEADRTIVEDYAAGKALYDRSLKLFNRGRNYGLRALRNTYPDIDRWLEEKQPVEGRFAPSAVPLLYWTAAAIGGAVASSQGDPAYLIELPKVGWLLSAALATDPDWNQGALYTAMISYSMKRPDAGPQAEEIARDYFQKAIQASQGRDSSPFVTLAEVVAIRNQDREEFERLLQQALAIDPDVEPETRLANILSQSRARWLLDREEELFY
jgi:predicted anti-sigma-YlaC factor YlaD